MKNERMARAMTLIDPALIDEANEMPVRKAKILTPDFIKGLYRYGAIAACAIIMIGVILTANIGNSDVLLYGESITEYPKTITEYFPRALAYSVEPAAITETSLPLELEFKKETKLTLEEGSMIILDGDGNEIFSGTEYIANGKISLCLILESDANNSKITTNRNYNIVLIKDSESGNWYVNIDKNN